MDLPLDVLFEAFSFLNPHDLLNLTRVSKSFRETLLDGKSKTVWQQCQINLCHGGIPNCPADLSEPHYAHLLFEPICHICDSKNAQWLSVFARVRLCANCFRRVCTVPTLPQEIYNALLPITTSLFEFPLSGPRKSYDQGKFIPHLKQLYEEYMGLAGQGAQKRWMTEKITHHNVAEEHLKKCRDYFNNCCAARESELEAERFGRKLEIIQRLKNSGWEEELITHNGIQALSSLVEVKKRKALTERAWEEIRPKLESILTKRREKRLRKDRTNLISQRCSVLKEVHTRGYLRTPVGSFFPNVGDLTSVEGIMEVILNTPLDTEVTVDQLEQVLGRSDLKYFAWVQMANSDLLNIVQSSSRGPTVDFSVLLDVTTLFKCSRCPMPISYPQVLVHDCHSREVLIDDEPADLTDVFEHLGSRPWMHSAARARLTFDELAHQTAKDILSATGLRDADITHDPINFNFWNPYVEYVPSDSCFNPSEKTVMRWSEALCFSRKLANEDKGRPAWHGLLRDEQTMAIEAERQIVARSKRRFPPNIVMKSWKGMVECVHCTFRTDFSKIKDHSKQVHEIFPVVGWDYRLDVDAIREWHTHNAYVFKITCAKQSFCLIL
ncbi:hypothetical protein GALMADRAFT_264184, partial [Galerina marginata CBS 339.88]